MQSGEHVHLTELDGLGLIDVAPRAQHQQQHLAAALQLGSLMSLARVYYRDYRERMQVKLRSSDGAKLRRVGPVETDPRDPAAAAGGVELCQALGRSASLAVAVDSAVNDHLRPASEDATAQTMPSATATRRDTQPSSPARSRRDRHCARRAHRGWHAEPRRGGVDGEPDELCEQQGGRRA